ncbi:MAG TPA: hypothetical protein VFQ61_04540, partial [Polyangiaceae bacterium]|nr:hypothetical protein [Polyangiaceae bacterium]
PRSTVQVRPYRPVLQYDSHHSMEARVELVLEIRHSTAYNEVVDQSESEILKSIVDKLHALGISQRGG